MNSRSTRRVIPNEAIKMEVCRVLSFFKSKQSVTTTLALQQYVKEVKITIEVTLYLHFLANYKWFSIRMINIM